jgi:hypothetical protein
MPEDMSLSVERKLWSTANSLRSILAAHDAVKNYDEVHPARLDLGAAEGLRDVVDTFNQLAVADPNLRLRDSHRLGPQEVEKGNCRDQGCNRDCNGHRPRSYHYYSRRRLRVDGADGCRR